jgi:HPt (histidine-containing phosphotransfer) domain-containing protein
MMNDRPASKPRPELDVKGVCTPEEAIGRLAGCRDLYADTVEAFFREVGTIAGQISEAIAADNVSAMRKTAHGLKGFAAMCGAVSVAEAAASLEQCADGTTIEERQEMFIRLRGEVDVARTTLRPFIVKK